MSLEPGDHLLLRLKTGDRRYRHYVVVSGAMSLAHKILTPARHVRVQDLSEDAIDAIIPWDGLTLPRRLAGHRAEAFLDVDSKGGRFTKKEIEDTIATAAGKTRRRVRSKSPAVPAIADAKRLGDIDDDEGPGVSKGAEPRPKEHVSEVADGEGWYVVTSFGAALSGSAISLKGVEHQILGDMALFMKGKRVCLAVWCRAEEVANRLRELEFVLRGIRRSGSVGSMRFTLILPRLLGRRRRTRMRSTISVSCLATSRRTAVVSVAFKIANRSMLWRSLRIGRWMANVASVTRRASCGGETGPGCSITMSG